MDNFPRVSQYNRFPQGVVYPGHPTCVAILIMDKYPNLEAALRRQEGLTFGNALGDSDIPGAGGNVHGALEVLTEARKHGADAALSYGDAWWKRCASGSNFGENQAAGLAQAEEVKAEFRSRVEAWAQATVSVD